MILKFMAYFFIPLYTFLFTKGYNWFTTNFSVIGSIDKKLAFFIWGIVVSWYFYMIFRQIHSCIQLSPFCSRLVPAAVLLLFFAITTPYLPEELPLKSFLHIVFAFVSTLLLLLFLSAVVWGQYRLFPDSYRPFLAGLCAIVAVSAVLLILAGIVSSALEIFITITTVLLSDRLADRIKKLSDRQTENS